MNMSKFIKVELVNSIHLYEYINLSFIYAIEKDGEHCKLIMSAHDDRLVLNETVESFLARIHCAEQGRY